MHANDPEPDYLDAALLTVMQVQHTAGSGSNVDDMEVSWVVYTVEKGRH